jgi:hypothetical protein
MQTFQCVIGALKWGQSRSCECWGGVGCVSKWSWHQLTKGSVNKLKNFYVLVPWISPFVKTTFPSCEQINSTSHVTRRSDASLDGSAVFSKLTPLQYIHFTSYEDVYGEDENSCYYYCCNYCSSLLPSPTYVLTIKVSKTLILLEEQNLFVCSLIQIYQTVGRYAEDRYNRFFRNDDIFLPGYMTLHARKFNPKSHKIILPDTFRTSPFRQHRPRGPTKTA